MAITLTKAIGPSTSPLPVSADLPSPWKVQTGATLPVVQIDNEYIAVMAAGPTTWLVQRGVMGSSASSHASGAAVTPVWVSGSASQPFQAPFWGLSGFFAETLDRNLCPEVNATVFTTGQIFNELIWIPAGKTVSNITFWSATTAASVPTHYAFGLYTYDPTAPAQLCSSADNLTGAWAANTKMTLAMSTPYTVTTSGLYYVAIGMTATTIPTLKGGTAKTDGSLAGGAPIIAGVNATSYATGALPAALGVTTAGTVTVWAGLS